MYDNTACICLSSGAARQCNLSRGHTLGGLRIVLTYRPPGADPTLGGANVAVKESLSCHAARSRRIHHLINAGLGRGLMTDATRHKEPLD